MNTRAKVIVPGQAFKIGLTVAYGESLKTILEAATKMIINTYLEDYAENQVLVSELLKTSRGTIRKYMDSSFKNKLGGKSKKSRALRKSLKLNSSTNNEENAPSMCVSQGFTSEDICNEGE